MVVITLGFEGLRSRVRIAFAIRPEANSDSCKWTAYILLLDPLPTVFSAQSATCEICSRPDSWQVNCILH